MSGELHDPLARQLTVKIQSGRQSVKALFSQIDPSARRT